LVPQTAMRAIRGFEHSPLEQAASAPPYRETAQIALQRSWQITQSTCSGLHRTSNMSTSSKSADPERLKCCLVKAFHTKSSPVVVETLPALFPTHFQQATGLFDWRRVWDKHRILRGEFPLPRPALKRPGLIARTVPPHAETQQEGRPLLVSLLE